jgi:hypothetical protein
MSNCGVEKPGRRLVWLGGWMVTPGTMITMPSGYSELVRQHGPETAGRNSQIRSHAMQVFHENIRYTDPPLPEEATPGQRLFGAYLTGGEAGLEREYERIYPSNLACSTTTPNGNPR